MSGIRSKICVGHHVKYPLFLADFNETWIFWIYFRKKTIQISDFMKIPPVEKELFYPDVNTDMTKSTVTFLSFAKAPTKSKPRAQLLILITVHKYIYIYTS